MATTISDRQKTQYVTSQAAEARVNVELETEGMTLNLGPQHPATHGTLRVVARLDGEQVVWADVVCGYMHRGYEKLTEVRTYPQVTTLINRIADCALERRKVGTQKVAARRKRRKAVGMTDLNHDASGRPEDVQFFVAARSWSHIAGQITL